MKPDIKHIAIFISFSGQGGVERMISNLAQGFLDEGINVDMVIARERGDHLESIPEGVRQVRLSTRHTYSALPGLVRYLRSEAPDVMLAVKDRAIRTAILARWFAGSSVILTGRLGTTVSAALEGRGRLRRWLWFTGMRFFYRRTEKIIAVSHGVEEDILSICELPSDRISVVPNPVVTPRMYEMAREPAPHSWLSQQRIPVIMGAGRLTQQKDFTTLVRAFAQVREVRECRLIILGEGEMRSGLESLVLTLGIAESVHMPGFQANPYSWLARCSLFALSSRWEGSPNVLTEAMALGIPVVSTDCPSGPVEILKEGYYGPLVPIGDERQLSLAMIGILNKPPPSKGLIEATEMYSVKNSVKGYLKAFGHSHYL